MLYTCLFTLDHCMFILENKYLKFKGLNLSIETIEGLLKHNGPVDDLDNGVRNAVKR